MSLVEKNMGSGYKSSKYGSNLAPVVEWGVSFEVKEISKLKCLCFNGLALDKIDKIFLQASP